MNSSKLEISAIDESRLHTESDYIQYSITAFQSIQQRDYSSAMAIYKDSLNLARRLEDDYKYAESLTNYGITQFFMGKLNDSIQNLDSALRICSKLNKAEKKNVSLNFKVLSNLILANLSASRAKDAINSMNNVLQLVKSIKDAKEQSEYTRQIIYIFFRVDSLKDFEDKYFKYNHDIAEKIEVTEDTEDIRARIASKIIYFLHKYLRDNDLDAWINCMNEESENFKILKDFNGFIFAVYNQYIGLYAKSPEKNLNIAKAKIGSISKALQDENNQNQIEEKPVEKILEETKEKAETAGIIYRKLIEMEEDISRRIKESYSKENQIPRHDSKVFFKIILRFALKHLDEENSDDRYTEQMRNQIKLTIELIENDELDLSSLNLKNIDPDIYNALNNLIENLMFIKYRYTIQPYFTKYLQRTRKLKKSESLSKFIKFVSNNYDYICQGTVLTKINYSSKGKREHFYQLSPFDNSIRIYAKKGDKSYKSIPLADIIKFSYGLSSVNLNKKFVSMQSAQLRFPWLFFSIHTNKRSFDFYLEESQLFSWFYGVKKFLIEKGQTHKINSVHKFILKKWKLKMMYQLVEEMNLPKNQNNPNLMKYRNIINQLGQGKMKYLSY